MADIEKQTPTRQSLCGSLRRDGHWKCLSLTLMIIGCLTAVLWCHLAVTEKVSPAFLGTPYDSTERSGPCRDGYIYIPVVCMVMLYLVYLVECWHSQTRLELRYKCDIETVYSVINKMQAALPVVWWKAICYHYVRRTRQVIRYRNGDAFTSTQIFIAVCYDVTLSQCQDISSRGTRMAKTIIQWLHFLLRQVYYERVDSNTSGAAFNFTQCGVKDISRPISDLEMYTAVKVKVSKGFSFATVDTEYQFEEQRSQFFQEYETKDDYMEGREGMDLMNVDFREYMIAFKDPNNLPWYVSHFVFWLASVFLLSWPLRTVMECKTAHLHYHVHKLFGSNYLDGENPSGLISRVSTMNSTEFEMSIRNNNVLVPSYSEAMLADTQDHMQQRHYGTIKPYKCKIPRSLTNVTLAARTFSAARRTDTPTVTMNHVKKFKSCSAFGITEFVEPSTISGSIRQQIQHLLKDRNKLQRKRSAMSQCSISGLSLGNGNVRFNIGTPGTPQDFFLAPSFSCHSVTSSRANEILTGDAAISSKTTRSQVLRSLSQDQCNYRLSQVNTHETLLSEAMNRCSSVPVPKGRGQDDVDYFSDMATNKSSVTSDSDAVNLGQSRLDHNFLPLPVTDCTNVVSGTTTATNTPGTPSSPPGYEEAIRMRLIASSLVTDTNLISLDSASEIELVRNLPSMRSPRDISDTEYSTVRDTTLNENSILDALPDQEVVIDRIRSNYQSSLFSDVIPELETFLSPGERLSEAHKQQHPHHRQHHYSQQQHLPYKQQPILKLLPKVSTDTFTESEESDNECLHRASSEQEGIETGLADVEHLLNRTSQRYLVADRSIVNSITTLAGHNGANDIICENSTSLDGQHSRRAPSSAGPTSADGPSQGCSSPGPLTNRKETSV